MAMKVVYLPVRFSKALSVYSVSIPDIALVIGFSAVIYYNPERVFHSAKGQLSVPAGLWNSLN